MRASSLNNRRGAAAIAACLLGSACAPLVPPVERPGTWQATGVNDYNLRAMVADRRDLDAGAPSRTSRGDIGSRAVTRLLITDRRRPLLNVTTSGLSQSSGGWRRRRSGGRRQCRARPGAGP